MGIEMKVKGGDELCISILTAKCTFSPVDGWSTHRSGRLGCMGGERHQLKQVLEEKTINLQ